MPTPQRFHVDPKRVVHETIDGETIIIHLESGIYYSLTGPAAEIWAMLAMGRPTDQIVRELEQQYDESPNELARATGELVRELRREELLEENSAAGPAEQPSNGQKVLGPNARRPFTPPRLQKYTDMEYFLQLDPIHEVDQIGWPNPPNEQTVR